MQVSGSITEVGISGNGASNTLTSATGAQALSKLIATTDRLNQKIAQAGAEGPKRPNLPRGSFVDLQV
jgi:hypothetical protein